MWPGVVQQATQEVALLPEGARRTAGILLLTLVAVEYGGTFLLRVSRARVPATEFQRSFFRAGHAHAGVLVVLALVCQLCLGSSGLDGWARGVAAHGVPAAAVLVPAGFFLSAAGRGSTAPNRWIVLVWLGAAALAVGVVTLGLGLLTSR